MSRKVKIHFYRARTREGEPWNGIFPGDAIVERTEELVAEGNGRLSLPANRYLLARSAGLDQEIASLVLYAIHTSNWPYFARRFEVGPITFPDESEEDPDRGIAHATYFSFFPCNCVALIHTQYGPGPSRLSKYLQDIHGLEVEFAPIARNDIADTIQRSGLRRLEVRVEPAAGRRPSTGIRPAQLMRQLGKDLSAAISIEAIPIGREAQDRANFSRGSRQFVSDVMQSDGARQDIKKLRVQLDPDADFAGDAMLDILSGVIVLATEVATEAASRRYLDAGAAAAATAEAHKQLGSYLHP